MDVVNALQDNLKEFEHPKANVWNVVGNCFRLLSMETERPAVKLPHFEAKFYKLFDTGPPNENFVFSQDIRQAKKTAKSILAKSKSAGKVWRRQR